MFISCSVPWAYPSALVHVLVTKILLTPSLLALEGPEIPVSGSCDYPAVWYRSLTATNGIVNPW